LSARRDRRRRPRDRFQLALSQDKDARNASLSLPPSH